MQQYDDGGHALVSLPVIQRWDQGFASGSDKRFPSLELVRLERWFFDGKPGKALDYGCGSGVNLLYLLERGYEVDGFDSSKEGLNLVGRKLKARPELEPRAHLTQISTDMERLPADDATYDYLICFSVLSLLGTKERVRRMLGEFQRVLKPGGKAILDVNGPTSDFARLATKVDDEIYEYLEKSGDIPFRNYCPDDQESFAKMLEPYFHINDMGFAAYHYMKAEVYEFIACVTKTASTSRPK